ncbi:protein regulator of cytokinesis 1-like isoform X2 [Protopterus annectens]|uniref:protein regulator of cytokinesis 1-like isoform X2 n=1 Tax=Protopterus annectens TaxID=7888 RepID=UPI001CF9E85A|nr:protein regulator of cytokinesis 1-like isoform X2 [Protopterus annectens]
MSRDTRKSEVLGSTLLCSINTAIARLKDIWNTIGIEEEMRVQRMETVKKHTENLFNDMIKEEENLQERLEKSIQYCERELKVLSQQLSMELPTIDENQTILQKEKNLSVLLEYYASEKDERMSELKQLKEQEEELCNDICSTPYYIPTGSIPTRQQLDELKQYIKELSEEKARRFVAFTGLRHQIRQIMKEIGQIPNPILEKEAEEAVCEDEDVFLLTNENLKALKVLFQQLEIAKESLVSTRNSLENKVRELWVLLQVPQEEQQAFGTSVTGSIADAIKKWEMELSNLQELKKQNLKKFIGNIRQELGSYWDKCMFSTKQREAFRPYFNVDITEDVLKEHDEELLKIKMYYEKGKDLFDAITKRESIWKQFLDLEKKARDPNRFANRGGALLKEERERTRVQKLLPKLEDELKMSIEKWEEQNGSSFLIYGQKFDDYVKIQWDEHHQKEHRKQDKGGKNDSNFRTPLKRPFPGSAQVTPSKARKVNVPSNQSTVRSVSSSSNSTVGSVSQNYSKPPSSARKSEHTKKSSSSSGLLNSTVDEEKV